MNHRTVELAATQAWILAGGEGKRLQPLTVSRPKPAVSFGGMFQNRRFHSGELFVFGTPAGVDRDAISIPRASSPHSNELE